MIPSENFKASIDHFLQPIAPLMGDPSVSEVMVNGPSEIWVERAGQIKRTDLCFSSHEALSAALNNIAQFSGQTIGAERPILEGHLPDGSRIEAILPPLAENGPIVAIRRFRYSALTVAMLIESGSMTEAAADYLAQAIGEKHNIVIAGGTGSGKTSLLGALSSFISDGERIVVIEDTREIRIQKSHVVYLETRSADERGRGRITVRDLLRATLRLRPDRIVVGEVRGAEALDLIQSMTSGHGGSLTTAHATSPQDTLRRLETMAMMDDIELPLFALRAQLASAIQMIVQVGRDAGGKRAVLSISRVGELNEQGDYSVQPSFVRDRSGRLRPTVASRPGDGSDE